MFFQPDHYKEKIVHHTTCEKCTPPIVVGIGGATRSGKTTLAKQLVTHFESPLEHIYQDDFFHVSKKSNC